MKLIAGIFLLFFSLLSFALPPPCAPDTVVGGNPAPPNEDCTPAFNDTDYGPTQLTGVSGDPIEDSCPAIPQTFDATYVVTNSSELNTALGQLGPREAVIMQDGTYSGAVTVPASASGLDDIDRSYILSDNLYGAEIPTSSIWAVQAKHITIAGQKRTGGTRAYTIEANDVRLGCQKYNGQTTTTVYHVDGPTNTGPFNDDLQIDNSIFENQRYAVYRHGQCQSYLASCHGVPKRTWIHHNDMTGVSPGYFMLYYGLAWSPEDLTVDGNHPDPKNRTDHIFENNNVEWYLTGVRDVFDIKTSANIFRNNCFNNTRPMSTRHGHDNLITGNWYRGTPPYGSYKTPGWGNMVVFNYIYNGRESTSYPAFDMRYGQDDLRAGYDMLWSYYSTSNGVYSNNVFNQYNSLIRAWHANDDNTKFPLLTGADLPYPSGNEIKYNKVHSVNYIRDYESYKGALSNNVRADRDYDDFKLDNPNYDHATNIIDSNVITTDHACGTAGVVNGIGTTLTALPHISGSPAEIHAPSWWN